MAQFQLIDPVIDQKIKTKVAYLRFCQSPLRNSSEVACEYDELVRHPKVVSVGFYAPSVLMVGTDRIIIAHKGKRYYIGDFVICIYRHSFGGYWNTAFSFVNVTNQIKKNVYDRTDRLVTVRTYMHPHIDTSLASSVMPTTGRLCIDEGQFELYQHIRKGEIYHAVIQLIRILEMYSPEYPYIKIEEWPQVIGDSHA